MRRLPFAFACLSLVLACRAAAAANSPVEFFTPAGEVKDVRQVQVRFRESMVPFGDPRELAPFEVACPLPGTGRWADDRNWVYDFAQDLPVPDALWPPTPGRHRIELLDADGATLAERTVLVRGNAVAVAR